MAIEVKRLFVQRHLLSFCLTAIKYDMIIITNVSWSFNHRMRWLEFLGQWPRVAQATQTLVKSFTFGVAIYWSCGFYSYQSGWCHVATTAETPKCTTTTTTSRNANANAPEGAERARSTHLKKWRCDRKKTWQEQVGSKSYGERQQVGTSLLVWSGLSHFGSTTTTTSTNWL